MSLVLRGLAVLVIRVEARQRRRGSLCTGAMTIKRRLMTIIMLVSLMMIVVMMARQWRRGSFCVIIVAKVVVQCT